MTNDPLSPLRRPDLDEALRARGFVRAGRSSEYDRPDGLSFRSMHRWHVLTEAPGTGSTPVVIASAPTLATQPGLWKWVSRGPNSHRRFEIPAWAVDNLSDLLQDHDETHEARVVPETGGPFSWARLLDWALATRAGRVPSGWNAPSAELITSWLPRNALTIQARGHVRQAELILNPERWALRVPLLAPLAPGLPPLRRAALLDLLADAHARWAMARVGLASGPDHSPEATLAAVEIDLTGAPPCELLFSAGLDVLRHLVAWLVETVEVLGDPAVDITVLDLASDGTNTTNPNERRQP